MKLCFCKMILGALVIVFAWWQVSWAAIALTVIGAIIIVMSIWGGCCCKGKKKEALENKPQEKSEDTSQEQM